MSHRFARLCILTTLAAVAFLWLRRPPADPPVHVREFVSEALTLDGIYRSMRGPTSSRTIQIDPAQPPRRIWIRGLDVEPVAADGSVLADGQQFICHVNLSYPDRESWIRDLEPMERQGRWLPFNQFTLVQGHYSIDFPQGFALPASSDQPFRLLTMAQNQDPERDPFDLHIRSRLRFHYDDELRRPPIPLNKLSWDIRVPAPYVPEVHDPLRAGESCAGDDPILGAEDTPPVLHFAVPPGRHEYRSVVDGVTKIPFPTTAHHISAHLHVYGVSLELRDQTAGRTLFKSLATTNPTATGIVEMTHYSSTDGLPLDPTHRYELIAIYDNPTPHVVDAMAVVYIYYKDVPPGSGERAS